MMNINSVTSTSTIIGRLGGHEVIVLKQKEDPAGNAAQRMIRKLEESDMMVRAHERAHYQAAGGYALGEPTYKKVIGPDGRAYAVEGEVKIDLAPVAGDPAATRRKAQILQNAALAPAGPSGADYAALDAISELDRSVSQRSNNEDAVINPYHRKENNFGLMPKQPSINMLA